jgi:REP element-mobilizing transposase RayT
MPRQARLDAPDTLHHVIVRGIEKQRIVNDRKDREEFVSRLGEVASQTGTKMYAWALMTNHAHILLRSGPKGLPGFMRRFLTGYAITYNIRHKRHGHLFQNRYKSIVCDEDAYFEELVRYIHLNPLRARLVKGLAELDRYPWSGHSVLMGRRVHGWQDREYVLSWFGKKESDAKRAYRRYVKAGVSEGKRSDLVGGGLVRSMGGWSEVLSLRRSQEEVLSDERILGSGEFVERLLGEADEKMKQRLRGDALRQRAEDVIRKVCKKERVNEEELKSGGRRGSISKVRSILASELTEEYGVPLAEAGRLLGVSTSAVSKMLSRRQNPN